MTWSNRILEYHFNLSTNTKLPHGVRWLFPYSEKETRHCMTAFYNKYYHDNRRRTLILGINPGRFGAGTTGIPFTDPIRLESICGISNNFPKRQELSSVFVYDVIHAYGGCEKFYRDFYISSISPLGFLKDNKNYNYYDDRSLMDSIESFIVGHLRTQIAFGSKTGRVYCLGQGKNFQYLDALNNQYGFFDSVVPLPHPRWVMQYRLRKKDTFLETYLAAFQE